MEPLTGIILAGGASSRFRSEKGMALYKGKPLIEHAIIILNRLCDSLLISANSNIYNDYELPVVHDDMPGCGPMMGIYSCLKKSPTPGNLILSVDTPLIPEELYIYLLSEKKDALIVVPSPGEGLYEPLIGYYHKGILKVMEDFIKKGNYTLPELFMKTPFRGLPVTQHLDFYHKHLFYNINTASDLDLLNEPL